MKKIKTNPAGMKRAVEGLMALLLFTFLVPATAWSFSATDQEFNGIKWGTPIDDVKGMVLTKDNGNIKIYRKEKEDLEIPGIKTEVRYAFYKGKFYDVDILCTSTDAYLPPVMKALIEKHRGKGEKKGVTEFYMNENRMHTLMWQGDYVGISYMGSDYKGKMNFRYIPLYNEAGSY